MNTYLKYQPAVIQFLAFLALSAGFFGLYFGLSSLLFKEVGLAMADKNIHITPGLIAQFKWAQLTSSVVSFVVPALLFGYYSSQQALEYIGIKKKTIPIIIVACIALLVVLTPFVNWMGELNAKLNFGSYQNSIVEMEKEYNRIINVFLQMKSTSDFLINILVMALLPALAEELFFRGALQTVVYRLSNTGWFSILISSLVFAMLHGTMFKILPIFVLGTVLGTVFYFTRNLWYSITIHFCNNALAVISVYYADKSPLMHKLAYDEMPVPLYLTIISLALGMGILVFIKNKSAQAIPEADIREEIEETDV